MKERFAPFLVVGLLLLGLPFISSLTVAAAMAAVVVLVMMLAILGLDRTSEWIMVAAFALAPCVLLVVPGFRFFNISDALFLVSIGLSLPRLMTRRIWLPPAFVLGSIAFVAISQLATLASPTPGESYYYAARVILMLIVIPVLLVWWAPRGGILVALVLAFAAGTVVSVMAGVVGGGGSRSAGLTQHPNVFGYTAVLTLSLLPFLGRTLPKAHRAWMCVTVGGIAFLGIMISGSRAALVVALFLVVLVPAAERSIIAALTVLGSGLVGVLVFGQRIEADGQGTDALSRLLGAGNVEGSDRARIEGVEMVWRSVLEHPFLGSGFTFSDDYLAHNAYVQVAAAVGFFGLAAFVVVCATMITPLLTNDKVHSRLAYPVVIFLVAAPVSPNLTDRYIGMLMGLSMVGVVAVHEARRGTGLEDSAQESSAADQPTVMDVGRTRASRRR